MGECKKGRGVGVKAGEFEGRSREPKGPVGGVQKRSIIRSM